MNNLMNIWNAIALIRGMASKLKKRNDMTFDEQTAVEMAVEALKQKAKFLEEMLGK